MSSIQITLGLQCHYNALTTIALHSSQLSTSVTFPSYPPNLAPTWGQFLGPDSVLLAESQGLLSKVTVFPQ